MAAGISGTVVDARGHPVAGARVFIASAPVPVPDIAALTDDDGRFALAAPAPGTYEVGAASGDAPAVTASVSVPGEGPAVELRVQMGE